MVTRTGDREIGVVSGRLPDNTGELACMQFTGKFLTYMQVDPKYPLSPISLVILACVEVPPLPDFF